MNKSKLNTLITGMQRTNRSSNAIIDEKIAQQARHSKGRGVGKIVFYLPDTDTWYELPKSPSKLDDVLASNGDKVY